MADVHSLQNLQDKQTRNGAPVRAPDLQTYVFDMQTPILTLSDWSWLDGTRRVGEGPTLSSPGVGNMSLGPRRSAGVHVHSLLWSCFFELWFGSEVHQVSGSGWIARTQQEMESSGAAVKDFQTHFFSKGINMTTCTYVTIATLQPHYKKITQKKAGFLEHGTPHWHPNGGFTTKILDHTLGFLFEMNCDFSFPTVNSCTQNFFNPDSPESSSALYPPRSQPPLCRPLPL